MLTLTCVDPGPLFAEFVCGRAYGDRRGLSIRGKATANLCEALKVYIIKMLMYQFTNFYLCEEHNRISQTVSLKSCWLQRLFCTAKSAKVKQGFVFFSSVFSQSCSCGFCSNWRVVVLNTRWLSNKCFLLSRLPNQISSGTTVCLCMLPFFCG